MSRTIRFSDSAGFSWSICEVPARREHDRTSAAPSTRERAKRGLYFFSRYATKRLAEYPAEWTRLPPADLMRLCQRAESLRDVTLITTGEHAVGIERAVEPARVAVRPRGDRPVARARDDEMPRESPPA
ncbi:MAG: hypothetical protein ABJD07_13200 [Gemmatimonadaceae bacterium]